MAYTPNTWATGDTITAAKLNNMESGISNAGGLVVPTFTQTGEQQYSCDITFAAVNAAVKAGKCIYAFFSESVLTLSEYYEDDTVIFSSFSIGGGVFRFSLAYDTTGITSTEEMYPEE